MVEVGDQQRLFVLNDPGGEAGTQPLPIRRFPVPLVDLETKLQFVAVLLIQSNEEGI